jgi:transcriptional pleiotropic regulator of transition state genes
MKSTGIIRKVDDLGRIVLPIELRRTLDIAERDELEIFMENDRIVLQKYEPACSVSPTAAWSPLAARISAATAQERSANSDINRKALREVNSRRAVFYSSIFSAKS